MSFTIKVTYQIKKMKLVLKFCDTDSEIATPVSHKDNNN